MKKWTFRAHPATGHVNEWGIEITVRADRLRDAMSKADQVQQDIWPGYTQEDLAIDLMSVEEVSN